MSLISKTYIYIMKSILRILFVIITFSLLGHDLFAKHIIVLRHKNKVKSVKLYVNNIVKIKTNDAEFFGRITMITDYSVILNKQIELETEDIKQIAIPRNLALQAKTIIPLAGVAYVGLDAGNRAMNDEKPVFDKSTVMIGSGMVLSHFLFRPLSFKKIRLGKKWKMEIINLGD